METTAAESFWMKALILGGILSTPVFALHSSVVVEDLPSPIFYTTFYPTVFEVDLGSFLNTDMKITTVYADGTCHVNDANTCNLTLSFENYVDQRWEHEGSKDFTTRIIGKDISFSCHEISPHFLEITNVPSTISSEALWKNYKEALSRCNSNGDVFWGRGIFKQFDKSKITRNFRKFESMYNISPFQTRDSNQLGLHFNAYFTFQSLTIFEHYVQAQSVLRALDFCNNKKFPLPLVSESVLNSALQNISGSISGKFLTFSADPLQIPLLPITECAMKDGKSLIIRSLIPLKPIGSDFKLKRFKVLPFLTHFHTHFPEIKICSRDVEGTYIHDNVSGLIQKSNCREGELCFISAEDMLYQKSNSCLESIINGTDITRPVFCPSSCTIVPKHRFPIFTKVKSDVVRILNDWTDRDKEFDIFINCKDSPFKVLKASHEGAVHVTLPCDCKLVHKLQEYQAEYPCKNNGSVKIEEIVITRDETILLGLTHNDNDKTTGSDGHGFLVGLSLALGIISLAWNILICCLAARDVKKERNGNGNAVSGVGHENDFCRWLNSHSGR